MVLYIAFFFFFDSKWGPPVCINGQRVQFFYVKQLKCCVSTVYEELGKQLE